jgi:CO dehydrogenase maturation factor
MKIAVAGKGGAGKTTVSGTIARAFARAGHEVIALDADANPMLGVSLGVGPEESDRLAAIRQALDAGEVEHETSVEGLVETFGTDAPDGVRLVVATRIDNDKPSCPCCGVSPQQLLQELERHEGRVVVADLEAGVGTLLRIGESQADRILVVANPTAKSIEVARRAIEIAAGRAPVTVIANRVRGDEDLEAIRSAVNGQEVVAIPEEPTIARADREGVAPIDVDADAPGIKALLELADRLAGGAVLSGAR